MHSTRCAATTNGLDLRNLHRAGHYFIVPITTGCSSKFGQGRRYHGIAQVPLPLLDMQQRTQLASLCLPLGGNNAGDRNAEILKIFQLALGDPGGLPGLFVFACDIDRQKQPDYACQDFNLFSVPSGQSLEYTCVNL
jgi:hypothetical protein